MSTSVNEGALCGCCGGPTVTRQDFWCAACRPHIGSDGPPWERTFFARYGRACPLQIVARSLADG